MGEMEMTGAAGSSATALRQPAYGEYQDQPGVEAQHEGADQEASGDRFARWAQWPVLVALAVVEVAWLAGLAYVVHRLVLDPLFG
jgi:hypothetical protein